MWKRHDYTIDIHCDEPECKAVFEMVRKDDDLHKPGRNGWFLSLSGQGDFCPAHVGDRQIWPSPEQVARAAERTNQ